MRTEDEIKTRIQELRGQLKKREESSKAAARETGANRTTLGLPRRLRLEGGIAELEWVLGPATQI
jgi:hypothetical protein